VCKATVLVTKTMNAQGYLAATKARCFGISEVNERRITGEARRAANQQGVVAMDGWRRISGCKSVASVGIALEETGGGEEHRAASAAGTSRSLRSRDAAPAPLPGRWPRGLRGRRRAMRRAVAGGGGALRRYRGHEGCGSAGLQDCDERGFLLPFSQARGIGERGGGSREVGR